MKVDINDIVYVLSLIFAFLLVAAVVFLIGAGIFFSIQNASNEIDCGVIVDRDYDSGYAYFSSDKYGGHMNSYTDTYTFTIEGEKDGETVRYTFEVTEQEYNSYKIGDWYER